MPKDTMRGEPEEGFNATLLPYSPIIYALTNSMSRNGMARNRIARGTQCPHSAAFSIMPLQIAFNRPVTSGFAACCAERLRLSVALVP
jgi:hypothetical protein